MKTFKIIDASIIDVLIIDKVGSEFILECIPDNHLIKVLDVRENIPYIFSFAFFLTLITTVFRFGITPKWLISAIVENLNPRVVITYIDNISIMGDLKDIFPKKTIISVQNGVRANNKLSTGGWNSNYKLPVYFGYGDYELDLMKKKQATVEEYYAVGSLKFGLFLSEYNDKNLSNSDTLCFVSQYRYAIVNSSQQSDIKFTDLVRNVYGQIVEYISANKYKLCVAMVHNAGEDNYVNELNFYKSIVNSDRVEFLPNNRLEYSSYKASIKSEVVITMDSALGFEMFGYGKKTLFCSSIDPVFAKNRGVDENFKKMPNLVKLQRSLSSQLTELMSIDNSQYNEIVSDAREYYMKCCRPYPHEIISSYILNVVTGDVCE
jgi:surface carbohydrate biosynthesis protein